MEVGLNTVGVKKLHLENLKLWSRLGYLIPVLNKSSVSDGGNLCPLLLVILKSV